MPNGGNSFNELIDVISHPNCRFSLDFKITAPKNIGYVAGKDREGVFHADVPRLIVRRV